MTDTFASRVIGGRYKLGKKLGQGGFGFVYAAEHVELGRPFALKFLHRQFETDEQFLKRFQREARLTAQLIHPNIVGVTDFGDDEQFGHYFVMEYLVGETLYQRVRSAGPIPSAEATRLMIQVVKAFVHAHERGVIHRDVKSANVFLVTDGAVRDHIKILDFGIARVAESPDAREDVERLTQSGMLMGSASYMSPEQAQAKPVDARSDIYSLGVVLYEMVTGQVPFKADSQLALLNKQVNEPPLPPSRSRPGLSVHPFLEMIVLRCLQKKPEARYQTAADLAADLEKARVAIESGADIPLAVYETTQSLSKQLVDDGQLTPTPRKVVPPPPGSSHTRMLEPKPVVRLPVIAVAVVVLLAAGGLWLYVFLRPPKSPPATPAAKVSDTAEASGAAKPTGKQPPKKDPAQPAADSTPAPAPAPSPAATEDEPPAAPAAAEIPAPAPTVAPPATSQADRSTPATPAAPAEARKPIEAAPPAPAAPSPRPATATRKPAQKPVERTKWDDL